MPTSTPADSSPADGKRAFPPTLRTARLNIRPMGPEDADFLLELLNDPDFIRHIGDKGVRTTDDARRYVQGGPVASYGRNGFGLCRVELKDGGDSIGICGLLRREGLEDPDVGFALLPRYRSQGYAFEAASAAIADGRDRLSLRRLLAITSPDNAASIRLLHRLGFSFERVVRLLEAEPEVKVFALAL